MTSITPEQLVAKYTQPLESGNEFEVYFPGGEPLKCWFPTRPSDIHAWKASLAELWKVVQSKAVPEPWKPFLPLSWEECVTVSILTFWSGPKPEDKINQFLALQLLRAGGGYVCNMLQQQIETKHEEFGFTRFAEKVEEEKKDLNTTTGEELSLGAPSSSSESTPTV